MNLNFRDAYCTRYDCTVEDFEEDIMHRILFKRASVARLLLNWLNPNTFYQERKLVQLLASTLSMEEVREEVDFYRHKYVKSSKLKRTFKFRVSGQTVLKIAKTIWT